MKACPSCGEPNPDRFRLCGICGTPLADEPGALETRRTVSVVFSDLVDSTGLSERLGTEPLREALALYFDAMRAVIERHGGTVEKYIGDAIMAVFGLPTAHEDDALRAVRAALEMRQQLEGVNAGLESRFGVRLAARTGVNTGEVVAGDAASAQRLVTGPTVNVAARLEQAAGTSEILLGAATHALVRDAVAVEPLDPLPLKGIAAPVEAYRLLGVTGRDGVARRSAAPLIGRGSELAALLEQLAAARRERAGRWITVVGPAGVGKTRLLDELVASAPEATVLRGRCLSYGEGITFWPLVEAIRSAATIDEDAAPSEAYRRLVDLCRGQATIADRLAPLLGIADAVFALDETFWAVRRLVEALAAEAPVLVVLDDIHWAEVTLLELVERLVAEGDGPFLVVASARSEMLEEHPFVGQGPRRAVLAVDTLSHDAIALVARNLLGAASPPEPLVDLLWRTTAGNPLFVEQLVSHLVERGRLVRGADDGWSLLGDTTVVSMPPTIDALLAARIDQLEPRPRGAMQAGSVVGLEFYRGAVETMSAAEIGTEIDASISVLIRRQLVRSVAPTLADEPTFRFGHQLIRDAAYGGLLLRQRALLHERFARWLETVAGRRLAELEEIVGYHLEQASLCRSELGLVDEATPALASAAADRLGRAGKRAFGRGDMPAAANLIGRAVALLRPDDPRRPGLVLDLAEIRADLGELGDSEALLQETLETGRSSGDERLATNARLVQLFVEYTLDPHGRSEAVVAETRAAIPVLEAAGDHEGLVRAWRLLGWVHGTACRYGAAERAVREAVEHARLAGDRRAVTRNQMSFAVSALHGPLPVREGIELCRRMLVDVADDRRAEGVVLGALAHLCAMDDRSDEARALYQRARTILEDLGGRVIAATVSLDSGPVELLAGDPIAAERELRRDYLVLQEIGERYALATVAAHLARAVRLQGRLDEAMQLTVVSEDAAAVDDVEAQNLWRRVRALILAEQGDDAASALVEEALESITMTDAPLLRAGTLLDLAEILGLGGRQAEAASAARAALALYERKQDRVDARRAASFLQDG